MSLWNHRHCRASSGFFLKISVVQQYLPLSGKISLDNVFKRVDLPEPLGNDSNKGTFLIKVNIFQD